MAITIDTGPVVAGFVGPNNFLTTISMFADCYQSIELCIPQSADRTFRLKESNEGDFTVVSDIIVKIWTNINGALLYSKSLSGGGVAIIADDTIMFEVSNTESQALPFGNRHFEVWIETSGKQHLAAMGPFKVIDTRNYD